MEVCCGRSLPILLLVCPPSWHCTVHLLGTPAKAPSLPDSPSVTLMHQLTASCICSPRFSLALFTSFQPHCIGYPLLWPRCLTNSPKLGLQQQAVPPLGSAALLTSAGLAGETRVWGKLCSTSLSSSRVREHPSSGDGRHTSGQEETREAA